MREILFGAKRTNWRELPKEKWWVEGLPQKMWGEWHIINPADENTAYPIDPDTLCQYIGFKDKNGNKIKENDIVKCNKRKDGFELYKVLWRNYYADFGVEPLEFGVQYPISMDENGQDIKGCDYEIVGNIFDNPELLKREQE